MPLQHINGVARAFRVRYWDDRAPNSTAANVTVAVRGAHTNTSQSSPGGARRRRSISTAVEHFAVDLFGLKIYTNYSIEVSAFTIAWGPTSPPLRVLTDEDSRLM